MYRHWLDPTDRLLVVLALIALVVLLGWYSFGVAIAIRLLHIAITGDPTPYFIAST